MDFFNKWIKEYWNNQSQVVSFCKYSLIKKHYLELVGNEMYLKSLLIEDGVINADHNFILLLLEKWLYRQSSILDTKYTKIIRGHIDSRTALINRYLFNNDGYYHNYSVNRNEADLEFYHLTQFYAFWLNFLQDQSLALELVKSLKVNHDDLFVVFMGLRRVGLIDKANQIGRIIGYCTDSYNPKLSTNTCPLMKSHSLKESLIMIKDVGFDAFDFSMESPNNFFTSDNYLVNAKLLKEFANSLGIICNQTHSVFPVWHKTYDKNEVEKRTDYTKRIIEISSILGAKNCVIHPINDFNEEDNFVFYQQFLPLAHKFNINIACENMWNWQDDKACLAACSNHNNYKRLIDLVNDDHFVACVDVGHAEMDGLGTSANKMIETLSNKVTCLHLHDNDLHYDRHSLPFSESIDFEIIVDALVNTNYQGDITFECDGFINRMPKELHFNCLKMIYQVGQYIKGELLTRRQAICLK